MKIKVSIVIGVSGLLFSHIVQAAAGWTEFATVDELIPTTRHYYEVKLSVKENPSGCKDKMWFYQNYSSRGSDKMFDTLLVGMKSGFRLRVYVTGICNINDYSEFSSVNLIR